MTEAIRDGNRVTVALGVSSTDPTTTLPLTVDSATGRLLTNSATASGDVVGPASSTDNAIARFDGTTGKLLQNSAVTVADTTGNISGAQKITLGTAATATGTIDLVGTTSGTVTLSVADAAGTYTFKLPNTAGNSGEFLKTDGSGNTSWDTVSASAGGSDTQVQYNNSGAFGGITNATSDGTTLTITSGRATTDFSPSSNDGAALGTSSLGFSDLHLATGATINFANGNAVITHSSGILTVSTGDLRVTTAGTDSASVVTVGGTQTLTNKTLGATTLSGAITGGDQRITGLATASFTQELDNGSKTASFSIDFATDQKQKVTLTANTMTLTLDTTSVGVGNYLLKIVNGGLATLTWASETGNVYFPGGTDPALTSSGTDIVTFYFDGTDWYGVASLAFS